MILVSENNWTSFKEAVYEACADVVGFDKKHQDWFDQNDKHIEKLLEVKNKLHSALLHSGLPCDQKEEIEAKFKAMKADIP